MATDVTAPSCPASLSRIHGRKRIWAVYCLAHDLKSRGDQSDRSSMFLRHDAEVLYGRARCAPRFVDRSLRLRDIAQAEKFIVWSNVRLICISEELFIEGELLTRSSVIAIARPLFS